MKRKRQADRADPPASIRRNGLTYELSPFSKYEIVLERRRREGHSLTFPPPERIWTKATPAQIRTLLQIMTCPLPVQWSGMLFNTGASVGLRYAPKLNSASVKALWDKGLLELVPGEESVVRASQRAGRYDFAGRKLYDRLRWRAILELEDERWALYKACRDRYREMTDARKQGDNRSFGPALDEPRAMTHAAIRLRMREIRDRDRDAER